MAGVAGETPRPDGCALSLSTQIAWTLHAIGNGPGLSGFRVPCSV